MIIFQLLSTSIFLGRLIGWRSLLLGLLASAFVTPLTTKLSNKYVKEQSELMKLHDQRSSLLTKALAAFRQLKLSVAEEDWMTRILECRTIELAQTFKAAIWMSGIVVVSNLSPVVLSGVALYHATTQGRTLSAAVAFTCIDLFDHLHSDISILPLIITRVRSAWLSLERIQTYLETEEVAQPETIPSDEIGLQGATVQWNRGGRETELFALKDLSLCFPKGELSLVTGGTGSGKSLLISALAGEATVVHGSIYRPRSRSDPDLESSNGWILPDQLAIVSQSPWLEDATIQENILFGLPMDQVRYRAALHSCALNKDLGNMKDGDSTVAGPKGVALSGGQRWRVALARALYSRASVILLDDILSALDAGVREWVVDRALCGPLATGRTRILATHHIDQCQNRAALIVKLSDGSIEETCRLVPSSTSKVNMDKSLDRDPEKDQDDTSTTDKSPGRDDLSQSHFRDTEKGVGTHLSTQSATLGSRYMTYFRAIGGIKSAGLAAAATTLQQSLTLLKSWGLANWTAEQNSSLGRTYILFSLLNCCGISAYCFAWYMLGLRASRDLAEIMTRAVFGAPLWWIEAASHGDIITRYTSDLATVDDRLPHDLGYLITCICRVGTIFFTRYVSFSAVHNAPS